MDYTMLVEIPILKVPKKVSIQEAKVTSEIWLTSKIPDVKLISFEVKQNVKKES